MAQHFIHPTALVDPQAELGEGVHIGPFCLVGPKVRLGAHTRLESHVVVEGDTELGEHNHVFQFVTLGVAPQDKKYRAEPTRLRIGHHNTIRESCTIHLGTVQDEGLTQIGDDNWIMAYVHVAHDCRIGSHNIFANSTQLAGHVQVGDHVVMGGFTGVHQFCRVGSHAMTAISTVLRQDLPPYVLVSGNPALPYGINSEGLKRRGFSAEQIQKLKRAYKALYRQGLSLEAALAVIETAAAEEAALLPLLDFIRIPGRGLVR